MPVTVPPMVKGPAPPVPPPPPPPEVPPIGPLHAATKREAVIKVAKRRFFVAGFIASDFSVVPSKHRIVASPAMQVSGSTKGTVDL